MSLLEDPRWSEAWAHLPDYLGNHVRVSVTALALAAGEFMRKAIAKFAAIELHQIEQLIDRCGDISLALAF